MKVLVTGSDGFVGRHTVKALRDRGIQVVEADKKTGEDLYNVGWANVLIVDEPDLIIHLAGSCSTLGSINRPLDTFKDTVVSAVTVAQVAASLQIPMLLTSSVKARDGMTPYGAAKQMVETWCLEMSRSFDFPLVINRPGTIYGPGQEGSVESGWIASATAGARSRSRRSRHRRQAGGARGRRGIGHGHPRSSAAPQPGAQHQRPQLSATELERATAAGNRS